MNAHKTLGIAGAIIFGILTAQTAAAERAFRYERATTVRAADLDLSREADARELYDRIRSAARKLCVAEESSLHPRKMSRRRSCIREAVDLAIERADVPLLTAVHLEQSLRLAKL